jgi:hypothetical protein
MILVRERSRPINVHKKLAPNRQLTIAEFLALIASRPNGERWELIEAAAVLNAAPVQVPADGGCAHYPPTHNGVWR